MGKTIAKLESLRDLSYWPISTLLNVQALIHFEIGREIRRDPEMASARSKELYDLSLSREPEIGYDEPRAMAATSADKSSLTPPKPSDTPDPSHDIHLQSQGKTPSKRSLTGWISSSFRSPKTPPAGHSATPDRGTKLEPTLEDAAEAFASSKQKPLRDATEPNPVDSISNSKSTPVGAIYRTGSDPFRLQSDELSSHPPVGSRYGGIADSSNLNKPEVHALRPAGSEALSVPAETTESPLSSDYYSHLPPPSRFLLAKEQLTRADEAEIIETKKPNQKRHEDSDSDSEPVAEAITTSPKPISPIRRALQKSASVPYFEQAPPSFHHSSKFKEWVKKQQLPQKSPERTGSEGFSTFHFFSNKSTTFDDASSNESSVFKDDPKRYTSHINEKMRLQHTEHGGISENAHRSKVTSVAPPGSHPAGSFEEDISKIPSREQPRPFAPPRSQRELYDLL